MSFFNPAKFFTAAFIVCFCGIFAGFGFYLFYSLTNTIVNVEQSKNWSQTRASSFSISQHNSGSTKAKSTTKINSTYTYSVQGVEYSSNRFDFSIGSDNFSKKRQASQLSRYGKYNKESESNLPVVLYDPQNPQNSVIDRSAPIEQLMFFSIFLIFPCFIGILAVLNIPAFIAGAFKMIELQTKLSAVSFFIAGAMFSMTPVYSLLFLWPQLGFLSILGFLICLGPMVIVVYSAFFAKKKEVNVEVEKKKKSLIQRM